MAAIITGDASQQASPDPATQRLYTRITLRVVPLLVLLYLVAFLDRVNISFASLTMNRDLHIGDEVFGLAAGIFFLGYLVFAVPSNCMLLRLGAPRWIAIIMVTWGTLSCALAFVHGTGEYIALRFFIGAAEAGFFPGIMLYLTTWLPGSARAGIMGLFTFSIPLSNVLGAPLSAAILRMDGYGGLRGWQLLFLLEGLPAVLLGCAVPWLMASGPGQVAWLTDQVKRQLQHAIEQEAAVPATPSAPKPSATRLAIHAVIYFFLMIGLYALGFWVPRILSSHGVPLRLLGWVTAIPFALGGGGMLVWSRQSDGSGGKRRSTLVATFLLAAIGMAATAMATSWPLALAGLSAAALGILTAMPVFWAALSQRFSLAAAALAIAAVNSVGNVGGFFGPYATGWLLQRTHSYRAGLLATAACLACGALFVMLEPQRRRTAA